MSRCLLAALAFAVLAVSCSAQTNSTGVRVNGATFGSNIQGYINMTLDYCEIKAAIMSGDYERASVIYVNGSNSVRGAALRSYQLWATSNDAGQQTYDLLADFHGGGNEWLDNKIKQALADRDGGLVLALIHVVINFKYAFHEVDSALALSETGSAIAADMVRGAPHVLDEAWAIWAGGHPNQCAQAAPLDTADMFAKELAMPYFGRSPTGMAITYHYNDAYGYSLMVNSSLPEIRNARAQLHVQWAVYHAQGIVRYAYASELAAKCGDEDLAKMNKGWAVGYFHALGPYLKLRGVSEATLDNLDMALHGDDDMVSYKEVRTALNTAMRGIKIGGNSKLGDPKFANLNTTPGCNKRNAPQE